jgi:hypothetical protein
MKITSSLRNFSLLATLLFAVASCVKDPYDDVVTNERSIEAVSLGGDLVQVGPAIVDRESGHVSVQVLMEEGTDLSHVSPIVQASYKSSVKPAPGEVIDFASNDNKHTYTITAASGEKREWVVELVPFTESLPGTYKIKGQVVYGGTGPEWGGGAVLDLTDKPWIWPETGGPEAELDNTLVFEFSGVTPEGHTYGTVMNSAGDDGLYADYQFIQNPATDVNHFYRKIPKGEGTWLRNYSAQTITFTFGDGSTATGSFIGSQTINLGNNLSKTIATNSLDFTLNSTDDWANIYSDYDKFVKRPRRYWIDLEKQEE